MNIHPTAIISPEALIDTDVEIGPGCVLTGRVTLAPGVRLIGNVYLNGPVEIGRGTVVYPFACVGFPGQDVKFTAGMPTAGVKIGQNCILREQVTVHQATKADRATTIGDNCFLMVNAHLGHDARIGDNVTMVNGSMLAGHAEVQSGATMGGGAAIHQFTRLGRLAMMQGHAGASMDVPPFCVAMEVNRIVGLNRVGLRRSGMPREHITRLDDAFRQVFRLHVQRTEMIQRLEEMGKDCPPVMEMAEFIKSAKRAICPGPARPPRMFTTFLHHTRRGKQITELMTGEEEG